MNVSTVSQQKKSPLEAGARRPGLTDRMAEDRQGLVPVSDARSDACQDAFLGLTPPSLLPALMTNQMNIS